MKAIVKSFIWWPGLNMDIEKETTHCDTCNATAAIPATASHHPWKHSSAHWDRIHIDIGECKNKHFRFWLMQNQTLPGGSGHLQQVGSSPLHANNNTTTTTSHTIEVLKEMFAKHEFPRLLTSNNGPQFTATQLQKLLESNRILHHKSPPYHPATNKLAENMVKNVKQWLKKKGKASAYTMH